MVSVVAADSHGGTSVWAVPNPRSRSSRAKLEARLPPIGISKLIGPRGIGALLTRRLVRWGHCYRCVYIWRLRRRVARMCPRCKSKLWAVPKFRPLKLGNGLGIEEILTPHLGEVRRLARRHGARELLVFGSVRRREATATSDVDLMVRWKHPVSLLERAGLGADLEMVLGRSVDLVNEGGLHWAIAPQVASEAIAL